MSRITGRHNLETGNIHCSDGYVMHMADLKALGGKVHPDGLTVVPVVQHFINQDYYNTPVEMTTPAILWSDDLSTHTPSTEEASRE